MNIFVIKIHPEQSNQLSFLVHIISLMPGVKNWHIVIEADAKFLRVEASSELQETQFLSLLNLYEVQMEVQA